MNAIEIFRYNIHPFFFYSYFRSHGIYILSKYWRKVKGLFRELERKRSRFDIWVEKRGGGKKENGTTGLASNKITIYVVIVRRLIINPLRLLNRKLRPTFGDLFRKSSPPSVSALAFPPVLVSLFRFFHPL